MVSPVLPLLPALRLPRLQVTLRTVVCLLSGYCQAGQEEVSGDNLQQAHILPPGCQWYTNSKLGPYYD